MTDDAFLAAILATPNDTGLRLIYADWLDEHGEHERAELIRVCEEMRRLPNFSDRYWQLKARRNELRPRCAADWLPLQTRAPASRRTIEFAVGSRVEGGELEQGGESGVQHPKVRSQSEPGRRFFRPLGRR